MAARIAAKRARMAAIRDRTDRGERRPASKVAAAREVALREAGEDGLLLRVDDGAEAEEAPRPAYRHFLLPDGDRARSRAEGESQTSTTLGWLVAQLGFVSRAPRRVHHVVDGLWPTYEPASRTPLDDAADSIAATRSKYAVFREAKTVAVNRDSLAATTSYTLPNGVTFTTGPIAGWDPLRSGCHQGGAREPRSSAFGPRGRRGRFAGRRGHRFAARARRFVRFHVRHNLVPMARLLLAFAGAVIVVKALTRAVVRGQEGRIRLPAEADEGGDKAQDDVEQEEEVTAEKAPVTSSVVEVVVEKH